ncbi:MAG: PD40 domain-containing protein [Bacteroidetes bacterium]|nr:PD40 domain-containing protein [Bacteroidota bacterium]
MSLNRTIPLTIVLIVTLIFSGCRNYNIYKLKLSPAKTTTKILPLKNDKNSKTSGYGYIFNHEVQNNICQIASTDTFKLNKDNMGQIEYRMIKEKDGKNPLWMLFCTATSLPFRTPALVGIPVGHAKGVIKLEVDVKDAYGNLIKTYKAKGKAISFITCYWGYRKSDAQDKSRDKAFVKAMGKIKSQMDADAGMLNSKLPGGYMNEQEIQAKTFILAGNVAYEKKEYEKAIENYTKANAIITEPKKYHAMYLYKLGSSYSNQSTVEGNANAIKYIKQALELDPKVDLLAPITLYSVYIDNNDYQSAIKWLDYSLSNFELNSKQKELINGYRTAAAKALPQITAGAALLDKPVKVTINNMGPIINGKEGDYFPSVTADESMLLFTSRRAGSTGGMGTDGKYDEDLWFCDKDTATGKWGAPKNFGPPVNTKNNNGIASFTGDGQFVVCGRCGEPDGSGSCDIYGANLVGNTWKEPVNMGTTLNSKNWDAQVSISADGKILVWCSDREGGFGNEDMWISKKKDDGTWTAPKNLGPVVNTSGSEYAPYLHPDGKTLYFASDNQTPRIGGTDIYKTTIKEDGSCTTPENLGYPINSEKDDNYFVLTPSGLKGYFASTRRGGYGETDIYEIVYPQEMKSQLTTFVGFVLNDETKAPLEANIKIEDLDSNKVVGEYVSNSASGKFVVILTPGHNYALTVSKQGYLFYSENFNIHADNAFKEVKKEVYLQQIKEGKKIVLNNIFFETGKSILTETSQLEIGKLAELLNQNPLVKVEISGHTDNVGKDAANLSLSQDRANVVVAALVTKGIPVARLIAKGYGKTQPYGPNDTDEQRALNRRTEFKILSAN